MSFWQVSDMLWYLLLVFTVFLGESASLSNNFYACNGHIGDSRFISAMRASLFLRKGDDVCMLQPNQV